MGQRLIDADMCIAKIKDLPVTYDAETVQRCIEVLSNAPTIDAEPVKQGKWLWLDGVRCSQCNYKLETTGLPSYCPHCGARMDGE